MQQKTNILIFGEEVDVTTERLPIEKLKFFEENPRVYSAIVGEKLPDNQDDFQALIYKKCWISRVSKT